MALRRLGAQLGLSTQVQVAFARAFATGTLLQPQFASKGINLRLGINVLLSGMQCCPI